MWAFPVMLALSLPCLPDELDVGREIQVIPEPPPETPPVSEALPAPPPEGPEVMAARKRGPRDESARYRVKYGVLGQLGEVTISFGGPGKAVRAVGMGRGALFGMGEMEKRLESEVDPARPGTPRWVSTRVQGKKHVVDTIAQPSPGTIEIVRRRTGKPDEAASFARGQPVMDPLGFLWWLRAEPPARPVVFEVLDGRALWLITVQPARETRLEGGQAALMLAGHAEPVFWDGTPDPERDARGFTLWLRKDAARTPLRLVMPLAIGEVRVELVDVAKASAYGATARAPGR